ncbi:MAG TPA: hypothetical protein DHG49_04555 [Clostridiales bacterium]|nr:hypothetical protein [Clostridiales bacterium]
MFVYFIYIKPHLQHCFQSYLLLLFLYSPLKDIFAPYYLPCYVSLFAISSYFPTAKNGFDFQLPPLIKTLI